MMYGHAINSVATRYVDLLRRNPHPNAIKFLQDSGILTLPTSASSSLADMISLPTFPRGLLEQTSSWPLPQRESTDATYRRLEEFTLSHFRVVPPCR